MLPSGQINVVLMGPEFSLERLVREILTHIGSIDLFRLCELSFWNTHLLPCHLPLDPSPEPKPMVSPDIGLSLFKTIFLINVSLAADGLIY